MLWLPRRGGSTRAPDPVRPLPAPLWPGLLALALFALLGLIVHERLQPSPVRPLDAPAAEFSAARAERTLERLLGDGRPHPTGSTAQAGVRARLLAELELLGLQPSVASGMACDDGVCAELHDILAEVPGSSEPAQLLVAAHYDSVAAGPGAGDDGQGVATLLELARALREAPLRQGVWLLFTDGEELGLLGARLFAQQHPLARQLKAAINLEARGNRGPSLMFQTGPDSAGLIRSFAAAPRPIASSLFAPVYRQLPNDTDFTVFLEQGMEGLNFAFLGGVEHYHTPLDTSAALDWRSVQHQGENVLACLRALSQGDGSIRGGELVYFDLFAAWLVTLPAGAMWPAALLALALWAVVLARSARGADWQRALGSWARAAGALALGLILPALATALLATVLQLLGALPFSVVARPEPFLIGVWLWVAAAQALAQPLLRSEQQRLALWQLTWLCWTVLGLALALGAAEASYLFVLPALLAAALQLWACLRGRAPSPGEMLAAALGSALLMMPVLALLPSTLELSLPVVLAAVAALAMSPLAPLVGPLAASGRARAALCAGALVAMGSQLGLAPYSAAVPQRLSLVLEVDGTQAHWLADGSSGELPDALKTAADFSARPARPHPWPDHGRGLMYVAPAPAPVGAPPAPRLERSGNHLQIELQAPADLWALGLLHQGPERIVSARWQGRELRLHDDAAGQRVLLVLGEERKLRLELELELDREPGELPRLLALALGLPQAAGSLQRARGTRAVASGSGDMTVLHLRPEQR